jgi:hypothetical protein
LTRANFVMMNVQHPAVEVIEQFRKHKILIGRHFPHMDNYIRVSLGIPEEMRAFWKTWDLLPWSNKFMHHQGLTERGNVIPPVCGVSLGQ